MMATVYPILESQNRRFTNATRDSERRNFGIANVWICKIAPEFESQTRCETTVNQYSEQAFYWNDDNSFLL